MARKAKGSGFKMKGSPAKMGSIQGTPMYKASVAKAKAEPIVPQTRTQADPDLVMMGKYLGESLVGKEIDYSLRFNMPGSSVSEEETQQPAGVSEMPSEYDLGGAAEQRKKMNLEAERINKPAEDAYKKEQKRKAKIKKDRPRVMTKAESDARYKKDQKKKKKGKKGGVSVDLKSYHKSAKVIDDKKTTKKTTKKKTTKKKGGKKKKGKKLFAGLKGLFSRKSKKA